MAGRSTWSRRPSTKTAPAITAPELPALTIASASPRLHSSKQTRMDESFFCRIAWPGCSPISTTCDAWRTSMEPAGSAPSLASSAWIRPSSPTRRIRNGRPSSRTAAAAPATTAAGAKSPPIASRAIRNVGARGIRALRGGRLDHFPAAVVTAGLASAVGLDRLLALGAHGNLDRGQLPVSPAAVAPHLRCTLLGNTHGFYPRHSTRDIRVGWQRISSTPSRTAASPSADRGSRANSRSSAR